MGVYASKKNFLEATCSLTQGAHPSNLQSIQGNRLVTEAYRAGQVNEILPGSQVSIPRRSLLERLGMLIRGR